MKFSGRKSKNENGGGAQGAARTDAAGVRTRSGTVIAGLILSVRNIASIAVSGRLACRLNVI